MPVTRWDPFRDLMGIQSELNRLFGRTYGGDAGDVRGTGWAPPLDAYETQDEFVLMIELPGVRPDDVDISVEEGTLSVSGERRFYGQPNEDEFLRVERRFGPFGRTLSLPQTADPERIQASFDSGVLTIRVPKREEAKPRKISIKATGT